MKRLPARRQKRLCCARTRQQILRVSLPIFAADKAPPPSTRLPSRVPAVLPKHVWQFDSTSRFFHTDRPRLSAVKRHLVARELNALLVEDSHDAERPEKGGLCLPRGGRTVCFLASSEATSSLWSVRVSFFSPGWEQREEVWTDVGLRFCSPCVISALRVAPRGKASPGGCALASLALSASCCEHKDTVLHTTRMLQHLFLCSQDLLNFHISAKCCNAPHSCSDR